MSETIVETASEAPKVAKPKKKAKKAAPTFQPTLPQTRILRVLAKGPLGRVQVCKRIGLSPISGTMPRCINGSKKLGIVGLIPAGAVKVETVKLDGNTTEDLLAITPAGKKILAAALKDVKRLPGLRDATLCVNKRYA